MAAGARSETLTDKVASYLRARLVRNGLETVLALGVVWMLSKEELAVLGLLLFLFELTGQLAALGVPDSLLFFYEQFPRQRREVAARTIGLLVATGLVAALLLVLLGSLTPLWLGSWDAAIRSQVAALIPPLALVLLLDLPVRPVTFILLGLDRQRAAGRWEVLTTVLRASAILGPLLLGFGVEAVVACLLAQGVIKVVAAVVVLPIVLPSRSSPLPPGSLRWQIRHAVPLGLSRLADRLNRSVDRGVVAVMLPAAALAEYTVATYDVPFVVVFPYGVGLVLTTRYVALRRDGLRQALIDLWHRGYRKVAIAVVPVGVGLIVLAPDLIPAVFGQEYAPAILPFQIYSAILLMRAASYGSLLQACDDTRAIFRITVAMLATNLVLSVPMTSFFGLAGAATATLLSAILSFWLTLGAIGRHLEIPRWRVVPLAHYGQVLALSCLGALAAYLVRSPLLEAGADLATVVAACAVTHLAVYLVLASALGVVGRDDWRSLLVLAWPRR